MNTELILYTGPNCHLCDRARQQIWPVLAAAGRRLSEVDITSDVALLRKYRVSIPVLADENGRELPWPFDSERIMQWLHKEGE